MPSSAGRVHPPYAQRPFCCHHRDVVSPERCGGHRPAHRERKAIGRPPPATGRQRVEVSICGRGDQHQTLLPGHDERLRHDPGRQLEREPGSQGPSARERQHLSPHHRDRLEMPVTVHVGQRQGLPRPDAAGIVRPHVRRQGRLADLPVRKEPEPYIPGRHHPDLPRGISPEGACAGHVAARVEAPAHDPRGIHHPVPHDEHPLGTVPGHRPGPSDAGDRTQFERADRWNADEHAPVRGRQEDVDHHPARSGRHRRGDAAAFDRLRQRDEAFRRRTVRTPPALDVSHTAPFAGTEVAIGVPRENDRRGRGLHRRRCDHVTVGSDLHGKQPAPFVRGVEEPLGYPVEACHPFKPKSFDQTSFRKRQSRRHVGQREARQHRLQAGRPVTTVGEAHLRPRRREVLQGDETRTAPVGAAVRMRVRAEAVLVKPYLRAGLRHHRHRVVPIEEVEGRPQVEGRAEGVGIRETDVLGPVGFLQVHGARFSPHIDAVRGHPFEQSPLVDVPDEDSPQERVAILVDPAGQRSVIIVHPDDHAPLEARGVEPVEPFVPVRHAHLTDGALTPYLHHQAIALRVAKSVLHEEILRRGDPRARHVRAAGVRDVAQRHGLRSRPHEVERLGPTQEHLCPGRGLGREKAVEGKNAQRVHQPERPDGALSRLRVEEVRHTQVVEKARRQQAIDREFGQKRPVLDEIGTATRLGARQDERMRDGQAMERQIYLAEQPVQRRRVEVERREILWRLVERGADEFDVPADPGMEDHERRRGRIEAPQIHEQFPVGGRPGLLHQTRQFDQFLVRVEIGSGGAVATHRLAEADHARRQMRRDRRPPVRHAGHIIFEEGQVCLEIGRIVRERIDGRREPIAIERPIERAVTGGEAGGIRLELDAQRDDIVMRRRRAPENRRPVRPKRRAEPERLGRKPGLRHRFPRQRHPDQQAAHDAHDPRGINVWEHLPGLRSRHVRPCLWMIQEALRLTSCPG